MPQNVGYSFQPLNQPQTGADGQGRVSGLSPQQAVRLLSLRIPERPSPTGIAPQALLQARGGAGVPGGGDMSALIRALMTMFGGGGAVPPPRVRPGLTAPGGPGGPVGPTSPQPGVSGPGGPALGQKRIAAPLGPQTGYDPGTPVPLF